MNLKGRQIGILYTFIAGLIILVHAVVPHNHQYNYAISFELESTGESLVQKKNAENNDIHCYVLNDLVSEKTTNSSLNQPLPDFYNLCLAGIDRNIGSPFFKNDTTIIFDYPSIFIKQFFVTAQSLQAPPSNA